LGEENYFDSRVAEPTYQQGSNPTEEAIGYYDKASSVDPNNFFALYYKTLALHDLGRYEEAIEYYDKALAINPNDDDALDNKQLAIGRFPHLPQSTFV
jgi:tetratricopeptide (TPR) repeat protein